MTRLWIRKVQGNLARDLRSRQGASICLTISPTEEIAAPQERKGTAFRTTHWTVVLEAALPENGAGSAFAQLYTDYWPPLYAYIRKRGYPPAEAQDMTQDFFTRLLEKQALAGVQRDGGRFRSFLLRSLENYLANEWNRGRAQKRGGGQQLLSLSLDNAEATFALDHSDNETPASVFERGWVCTLLDHVMARLRQESARGGKNDFFEDVQSHLQGDRDGLPYSEIGERHRMSEGAVKVAVHRLRQRYGQLLREEILRTVSNEAEVDEELRYLISVVGK